MELRDEKEQLEEELDEKQRYIHALEYELEQLKRDKPVAEEHVAETKQPSRPWFMFKIKF